MYEPSPIGKVCIIGSALATPFAAAGVVGLMVGHGTAVTFCFIALVLIGAGMLVAAIVQLLRADTNRVTWHVPPSAEGANMTGGVITLSNVALTLDEFYALVVAHVAGFEDTRPRNENA